MLKEIKHNIWQMKLRHFGSYIYLIKTKNQNIVIDTSSLQNRLEIINNLKKLNINPENINILILTHNHYDHTDNIEIFKNAKIYGNKEDFKQENILNIDKLKIEDLEIIKTPGHSKGGICIYMPKEKILFSGDTLFHRGTIGRTDLPGSSEKQMIESLEKLKEIDYEILCPGHGDE